MTKNNKQSKDKKPCDDMQYTRDLFGKRFFVLEEQGRRLSEPYLKELINDKVKKITLYLTLTYVIGITMFLCISYGKSVALNPSMGFTDTLEFIFLGILGLVISSFAFWGLVSIILGVD